LVALANPVIVDEKSGSVKSEVCSWHNPDLRPLADLGLLTAALPTFEAQCRLTAAFQTQGQAVSKVAL